MYIIPPTVKTFKFELLYIALIRGNLLMSANCKRCEAVPTNSKSARRILTQCLIIIVLV